jgi:UDP-N-acetylmuramate--alanine ligase
MKPTDAVYFVLGIGGSGMSSLAHILLDYGFTVIGYDKTSNNQVEILRKRGVQIFSNSNDFLAEENNYTINFTVHSSAIKNHRLLDWSKEKSIQILHRSKVMHELFSEKKTISIAGSHGKTTTTAMVSQILVESGLDPSIMIGGETAVLGEQGGRWGKGEFGVYESDESDGTFLNHSANYRLLTNIDEDHLDYYKDRKSLVEAFCRYIQGEGRSILYLDDPGIREALESIPDKSSIIGISKDLSDGNYAKTYLLIPGADEWTLENNGVRVKFSVPFLGDHYRINASVALALGLEIGLRPEQLSEIMGRYSGVKRRMEVLGKKNGIIILDDYGHHPTEVNVVLDGMRLEKDQGRVSRTIVLFQPHRYTRTENLYKEFASSLLTVDTVYLLPIYSAGEEPIPGVSTHLIQDELLRLGKESTLLTGDIKKDSLEINKNLSSGDLLLSLGAGSVRSWGEEIVRLLDEL